MLIVLSFLLTFSINAQQKKVLPAQEILANAYEQAKMENKNIILIFHASWCGWCKKMDNSMQDEKCKKYFDNNYVTVHLTVDESKENKNLENPGAAEIRLKYNGGMAGLPFWVVLDKEGKLLGDCFIRKDGVSTNIAGENIGCPANDEEVAAFIKVLKQTSSLSDAELNVIANRFRKNKS